MEIRPASPPDAEAIALLHAESWRENYRGAFTDAFLDGEVFDDRRRLWDERLGGAAPSAVTLVAEPDGALAGFAHTAIGSDPTWGALLDNLHVDPRFKRRGVGRSLMAATASAVIERAPGSGLYLWVLEQNEPAQAFYRRLGGVFEGREESEPPGGGRIVGLRLAWSDPAVLLRS